MSIDTYTTETETESAPLTRAEYAARRAQAEEACAAEMAAAQAAYQAALDAAQARRSAAIAALDAAWLAG